MKISDYCKLAVSELGEVFSKLDDTVLEQIVDNLINADRIFLLGGGREGLVTRTFAMRLMHLGKKAHWVWDDTTPSINEGDLMFIATGSCTGGVLTHVAKKAKENAARVIILTADSSGPVGIYSDLTAYIPASAYLAKGDLVKTEQMMGSLFEQSLFILLDSICNKMKVKMNLSDEETEARHRNIE